MEIILLERVEKLGNMGDIVRVRDGYARNFLLPQKKALRATVQNKAQFEIQREELEKSNAGRRSDAENAMVKLDGQVCVLLRQASDSGYLYGSVTARDIATAASELGVPVRRQQVLLDRAIKLLGIHPIRLKLHPEVSTTVKVIIARSEEEASAQRASIERGVLPNEEDQTPSGPLDLDSDLVIEAEEFFEEGAGPSLEADDIDKSDRDLEEPSSN
jgi:large subunit ribosomal protein L9